jgi:membrane associated rhomboid family serine protease
MIILPTALEPPERDGWPERNAWVCWCVIALIAVDFAVTRFIALDQQQHWQLVGDPWFRSFSALTSWCSLYSDPTLFAPWQLWTYGFIHDSWILVATHIIVIIIVGRAVERWLGSVAFAGAVLTLMPLAAVIHLLLTEPDSSVLIGADGLVMGVLGMACLLFPHVRVRWGFAYFAVLVAGYRPLVRMPLPLMALLVLVVCLALHIDKHIVVTLVTDIGALTAGAMLGLAGRRLQGTQTVA